MSAFTAPSTTSPLVALDRQRLTLEQEAFGITEELNSTGKPPVGVSNPLVDREGFPLADIDHVRVRTLRQRLAVIRTDHKALMLRIEAGLKQASKPGDEMSEDEIRARLAVKPKPKYDNVTGCWVCKNWDGTVSGIEGGENVLFDDIGKDEVDKLRLDALSLNSAPAPTPTPTPAPTPVPTFPTPTSRTPIAVEPFAVVNSVAPGGPAFQAGLLEGDIILKFGRVTYQAGFRSIPEVVGEAARTRGEIVIDLLRDGAQSRLTLRP
eukprot:CAMPEP_0197553066 /NCGR_PEP_ID=MMETSP1320-20131121/8054_1 /TAXON_ID=91990 /ORGANISM="Bolidomonas sp., Strain RCC2347" /LENGTH=264 /DNA_ID=CAMNT_0043113781 /DNA_START=137 /DNA_END=927 /DNA_ORIENTATION=+